MWFSYIIMLTLYTPTSVTIFSKVFSLDSSGTEKENLSIKASRVGNRFIYSYDVKKRLISITVRRF